LELWSRYRAGFVADAVRLKPVMHAAADCDFSKLEGDGAGLSDDPCATLDEPRQKAGQRRVEGSVPVSKRCRESGGTAWCQHCAGLPHLCYQ